MPQHRSEALLQNHRAPGELPRRVAVVLLLVRLVEELHLRAQFSRAFRVHWWRGFFFLVAHFHVVAVEKQKREIVAGRAGCGLAFEVELGHVDRDPGSPDDGGRRRSVQHCREPPRQAVRLLLVQAAAAQRSVTNFLVVRRRFVFHPVASQPPRLLLRLSLVEVQHDSGPQRSLLLLGRFLLGVGPRRRQVELESFSSSAERGRGVETESGGGVNGNCGSLLWNCRVMRIDRFSFWWFFCCFVVFLRQPAAIGQSFFVLDQLAQEIEVGRNRRSLFFYKPEKKLAWKVGTKLTN